MFSLTMASSSDLQTKVASIISKRITKMTVNILVSTKLKEVLSRVERLVLEIALHDPATIEKLIECKKLGPNETLQQFLPASLFLRLKKC